MSETEDNSAKQLAKIGRSEKVWIAAIGAMSGIVGAALTYSVVGWFQYQNRDRELDLELAKIALSIMAGQYEEDSESSYPARRFAVDALEKGTGVKIAVDIKEQWAKSGDVEFGDLPINLTERPVRGGARAIVQVPSTLPATLEEQFDRMVFLQCVDGIAQKGAEQDVAIRFCRDNLPIQGTPFATSQAFERQRNSD